jgi:outer membrane protein
MLKNRFSFYLRWGRIRGMRKTILGSSLLILLLVGSTGALTLNESIGVALKNNPAVIAAQKKLDAAGAKLNQAVGAFFPTIKLNGNYTDLHSDPQVMQVIYNGTAQTFSISSANTSKTLTATLSQPMLQTGLFPGFKIAERYRDAAAQDLQKTIRDTSYDVTSAYFGMLSADKLAKVAEDSLALANSHLNQVQAMLDSGVATKADLLRAEVQVANSELALTRARNNFELAKDSFNNVLGNKIDEPVTVAEVPPAAIPALPDYQTLLKSAYDNRPDWKGFIYSKNIAEENLALAKTAYFPTINLSGQTGNQITDYSGFESNINSWSITGTVAWTIFDGLGIQNRVSEAAANLDVQRANEDQIRNGIALDVRNAYLNLKSVIETLSSAKKAVDFAEENYKVSSLRFASGVGTNIEVIDAQVAFTQAKTDFLNATFGLEIAKARINKAVGTEVM